MGHRLIICFALLSLGTTATHAEQPTASPPAATEEPVPEASAASIPSPTPPHEMPNEVRIAIDTSGSMKHTDPRNLRVPALKLLVNLLPDGTRAGVWLFDARPRELVAVGTVDRDWKTKAERAAESIHSKGAHTDIEAALSAATAGWDISTDEERHRHLILLTDGKVDISKTPSASAASRSRILNERVPALQQADVAIHTIALSDKSDEALMRQLALSTGGWIVTAENAEQLQRSFLQMFQKAAPHDNIPILGNRFTVDASVEEFTLLVVLQADAQPTRLTAPDGSRLSRDHLPGNAHWLHQTGYDLVTVTRPATGEWQLEANINPGNQVLVVANLKMETANNPSYLKAQESPVIAAHFTERGHTITREDFLDLLGVRAELSDAKAKREFTLSRDAQNPGTFVAALGERLPPGEYTLLISADGKTFQRESRQTFRVMPDLIAVDTAVDPATEPPGLIIRLTPNPAGLAPDSVSIQGTLTDQANQSRELALERIDGSWQIKLHAPAQGERWIVNFAASGKTPEGASIEIPMQPLPLVAPPATSPEPAPAETPEPQAQAAWPAPAAIAVGVNLLLLVAVIAVRRIAKRRRDAAIARLLSKLSP